VDELRRYETVEYAEALMLGGEPAYRQMSNLEGLYARGFKQRFGSNREFVHHGLQIRVTSDVLGSENMLRALDAMMARKQREMGTDG